MARSAGCVVFGWRLHRDWLTLDNVCGRYALAGDWSEFTEEFELEEVPGLPQRYNIAPSAGGGYEAQILVERGVLVPARFWYIPRFWKKPLKQLPTSFNVRSETALEKPFFRGAKRCLVPTSGWREFPGPSGRKRAFQFERRDETGRPRFFAFGGLCTEWRDHETGEVVSSFAILTTEPSEAVRPHHHRMPLLVAPSAYRDWLDGASSAAALLKAAQEESQQTQLFSYECSTYGNSTRVEGEACIAPREEQKSLFD